MAPVADSARRSTPGARAARLSAAITACLWLAGCGTPVIAPKLDPNNIPDAVPGDEPRSRYGNPASYEVFGKRYYTLRSSKGYIERGIASWYGDPFHGERTSSGETYDMYRMTAAHKLLPLPTYVLVKNLENGRSATVKVNDRGPFKDNRIIDLSYAAALKLGVVGKGTAMVEIRALDANGNPSGPPLAAAPAVPAAVSVAQNAPVAPIPAVTNGPDGARAARIAPPPPVAAPVRPASTPTPAPPSGTWLQVGAYADRRNAESLSERLAARVAAAVEIREIVSNNKVFYRVQIGPLPSTEVADQAVAAVEKLGITQHHFIAN